MKMNMIHKAAGIAALAVLLALAHATAPRPAAAQQTAPPALNSAWQMKTGAGTGTVITIIDSDGYFTHVESGWETVRSRGNITIGSKYLRYITQTGERTWSCQLQTYNGSTFALSSWVDCTLTLSADVNALMLDVAMTSEPALVFTRVK